MVAYIRDGLVTHPACEAEEHVNDVLNRLALEIERGDHVRKPHHG